MFYYKILDRKENILNKYFEFLGYLYFVLEVILYIMMFYVKIL